MMKKIGKIFFVSVIAFILSINNVYAGNTLGDLKDKLNGLKEQKAQNQAAKNKTQSEINAENAKISDAHMQVEQAENDIELAKAKIEDSNNKIADMKEESQKLLVFYQIMQGENRMMNYVTSAGDMTDMMMRIEAVSQVLDYNKNKLVELENLILENEQLEVDLTKKQEELNGKIVVYEQSLASLQEDLSSLVEVTLDIDQQIEAQQKLIKYYEEIGCKDDEDLDACLNVAGTAFWMRPTEKGYISSGFGYRSFYLNGAPYSDFHPAVDVAGLAGGTPLYSAANGYVAAVINRASCGGNQVYIHSIVQGQKYTITYAHMAEVYVKVGQTVTQQTVVGTLGGGGYTLAVNGGWDTCSTGYHLHFGITKGFYLSICDDCYSSYSKYISNSIVPPMMPAYGNWYYARY